MVTEWGTIGWWEVGKTDWGTPVEIHSSDKAEIFRRGYQEILAPLRGQVLGSYAFYWGQKQERTPTWFGMGQLGLSEEELLRISFNSAATHAAAAMVITLTSEAAG